MYLNPELWFARRELSRHPWYTLPRIPVEFRVRKSLRLHTRTHQSYRNSWI